jgi:hypothetical protein
MSAPRQTQTAKSVSSAQVGGQVTLCAGFEQPFWHQIEVLAFVRKTQTISDSYCKQTEVGQYIGQPIELKKNHLMNYMIGPHLHVVAIYQGKVYMCDGLNFSVMATEIRVDLARRMGVGDVRPLRFYSQTSPSHCTHSAVLIMIELLKLFKQKVDELPFKISVPRYLREKLVGRIHKKASRRPSLGTRPGSKD